jgi:hypothetical protein
MIDLPFLLSFYEPSSMAVNRKYNYAEEKQARIRGTECGTHSCNLVRKKMIRHKLIACIIIIIIIIIIWA